MIQLIIKNESNVTESKVKDEFLGYYWLDRDRASVFH